MSKVWALLDGKKEKEARSLFHRILPLINFENMYGIAAFKAVLVRRGVIKSDTIRSPGRNFLDAQDHAELDRMLAEVSDLLTWKKG